MKNLYKIPCGRRFPMPRPFVAALYKYDDEYRFANGRFDTVFTYLPDYGKKECYVMEYGKYYSLTYETVEYEKRIDASENPQLMETDDFLLFRMSLPTEVWTMYNGTDGKADVLFLYDKTDKKLSLLKPDKQNKISSKRHGKAVRRKCKTLQHNSPMIPTLL